VVAARLRQARALRGLSQRETGVRMGLDKETGSARVSRYESESMAISLEALFELAQALEVPPAYLLASTPAMADAILALGSTSEPKQSQLADAVKAMSGLSAAKGRAFLEQMTNAASSD